MNKDEKIRTKEREPFLDYFRGIIIFLMIQGHLFRALLDKDLKSGFWFRTHEYIHGVVAPGFLFLAGFLFYYTIRSKSSSDLIIKVRHLSGIIVLGYFLHLPFFSLQKIIEFWGTGIEYKLLRMDILQTIGFSLLIAIFVWKFLNRIFIPVITFIVLFNFVSPFIINVPDNILLASFVDNSISQFPLVFWSIYLFMGILAAKFLKKFSFSVLILSVVMLSIAHLLPHALIRMVSDSGKVLLLFSIIRLLPQISSTILTKFLTASRESLFLYMSHLMVIYGSPLNPGLSRFLRGSLSIPMALLLFILLILTLYPLSFFLNRFKLAHADTYNSLKYGFFTFFLIIFLLSKW